MRTAKAKAKASLNSVAGGSSSSKAVARQHSDVDAAVSMFKRWLTKASRSFAAQGTACKLLTFSGPYLMGRSDRFIHEVKLVETWAWQSAQWSETEGVGGQRGLKHSGSFIIV